MPRKGPVTKRDVLPDPVYGSKLLTRFINKWLQIINQIHQQNYA